MWGTREYPTEDVGEKPELENISGDAKCAWEAKRVGTEMVLEVQL